MNLHFGVDKDIMNVNSENYEESGYNLDLELLTILTYFASKGRFTRESQVPLMLASPNMETKGHFTHEPSAVTMKL
jgi:hypothetical protein